MNILSYFHGVDPAAALIKDGKVVAFVEEERLLRFKHAVNYFPVRSIEKCLQIGNISLKEVDHIVYGWDAERYESGGMLAFYDKVNQQYPPDGATKAWQSRLLSIFKPEALQKTLHKELTRWFDINPKDLPQLEFYPHHKSHAASAYYLSHYDDALVLTLDGSGDSDCTTIWHGKGLDLEVLHQIEIPNSLGWFYAAITEFLGFSAYDGEYKVMGLAAYGRENLDIRERLHSIVKEGPNGFDYLINPHYIHHGKHTYSDRYTDELISLMGMEPRHREQSIDLIHEDIAFEAQRMLEETVLRLINHFKEVTACTNLCIGGGVGLNVKLNSRLQEECGFEGVSPFPIPGDSGLGIGAAIGLWVDRNNARPEPLRHLYLGPQFSDEEIEKQLKECGLEYEKSDDIAKITAELLASGEVIGWFQGAMEGGARALGGRSILADPRREDSRDRVNSAIKFREYWRPFCPSMTASAADRFLENRVDAPYMVTAFKAQKNAKDLVPAIVHVDGTVRVQVVDPETNPRYHELLTAFEDLTGVSVLLNTSFNIKGEAIVCTPRDAIRTFFATGIDALAIGNLLVKKPKVPTSRQQYDGE